MSLLIIVINAAQLNILQKGLKTPNECQHTLFAKDIRCKKSQWRAGFKSFLDNWLVSDKNCQYANKILNMTVTRLFFVNQGPVIKSPYVFIYLNMVFQLKYISPISNTEGRITLIWNLASVKIYKNSQEVTRYWEK